MGDPQTVVVPARRLAELGEVLHRDQQVAHARHQVHALIRDLLEAAVKTGDVRDDVPLDGLASYCMHALAGGGAQRSKTAVHRIVSVTLDGLRPPR